MLDGGHREWTHGNTETRINTFYTEVRDYIAYLISCFEPYIDNQEYKK